MAKVSYLKLGLKKDTSVVEIPWGDQVIEVRKYLPIQEKIDLITRVVTLSLDDNNFANPMRKKIFMTLEMLYAYTNINFTDKQKEDFLGLYDSVISSGLWSKILNEALDPEEDDYYTSTEYWMIHRAVDAVIDEIYKYKNSALGIMQAIVQDYKDLDLDAEKLEEKIANKENLQLLHNVMEKLG